jgi:hypothetical protein
MAKLSERAGAEQLRAEPSIPVVSSPSTPTRSLVLVTDLYKKHCSVAIFSTLFAPGYETGLLFCLKLNMCYDFTTYTFPLI